MLIATLLTTLLSNLPSATSIPAYAPAAPEPYNCGYVYTRHNSSAYAGLSAFKHCAPFYYNTTLGEFEVAFAYGLYGGCRCQFHVNSVACEKKADVPTYQGPTEAEENQDAWFASNRPTWYNCADGY